MNETLTAVFKTRAEAETAIAHLVAASIPRSDIRLLPGEAATTTTSNYDVTRDEKGFWASLADMFMPDEDRHTYTEAMSRGHIVLSVSVGDAKRERAEEILEEYGSVDLDATESTWRSEGWSATGRDTSTVGGMAASAARGVSTAMGKATDAVTGTRTASTASTTGLGAMGSRDKALDVAGEERLTLAEETLKVGKRQVGGGRVKVRRYVVETPVEEQVHLRRETVHVERRPVDRAATGTEALFEERTIEATATSEEAVVSKDVRVTEELVLTKDVQNTTETVRDTVRSTKVDVEDALKTDVSKVDVTKVDVAKRDATRR